MPRGYNYIPEIVFLNEQIGILLNRIFLDPSKYYPDLTRLDKLRKAICPHPLVIETPATQDSPALRFCEWCHTLEHNDYEELKNAKPYEVSSEEFHRITHPFTQNI